MTTQALLPVTQLNQHPHRLKHRFRHSIYVSPTHIYPPPLRINNNRPPAARFLGMMPNTSPPLSHFRWSHSTFTTLLHISPKNAYQMFFVTVSNGARTIKPHCSISRFLTTTHSPCSRNRTSLSKPFNSPVNYPLQVCLTVNYHSSWIVFETELPRLNFGGCTKTPSFACSLIPASRHLNPPVHHLHWSPQQVHTDLR